MRTPEEWIKELYRRRHDGHALGLCPECMLEALRDCTKQAEAESEKVRHLLEGARFLYKQMDRIAFPPSEHPDAMIPVEGIRNLARQALLSPIARRFIEDCTGRRIFDPNEVGRNLSP